MKGTHFSKKVREVFNKKYKLVEKGALLVSMFLINKIYSESTKIKWYVEANLRIRQNNKSKLYKPLGDKGSRANNVPPR